jgi:hypothetical protein
MSKASVPKHIEDDYTAILEERKALEDELTGHQNNLRKLGRTAEERADHPDTPEHLARVNDLKARIAAASFEHAELARTRARILGGKNHMPPPG